MAQLPGGFNMAQIAAALNQAVNQPLAPLPPNPPQMINPPRLSQLPPIPLTNPGDDWVTDFADVQAFAKAKVAGRYTKNLKRMWLASEQNWKYRIGKNWKGKKVLGLGGQGIVGHWSYEGSDRDQKSVKDVAVKQAVRYGPAYRWGDGLETEARFLLMMNEAKSPHILRMYKHLIAEEGQKTIDLDWGMVHRIFLEFCLGGDLHNFLNKYIGSMRPIDESDLWAVFHCLARGTLVMHHGSEDTALPRAMPADQELVHFDLKLGNVLIGESMLDLEHRNQPAYKISDFGLAAKMPPNQSYSWRQKFEGRGTEPWLLPEQVTRILHPSYSRRPWGSLRSTMVPNPRYCSNSNVWQIGLILWILMRKIIYQEPQWRDMKAYQSTMTPRLKTGGYTLGTDLDISMDQGSRSMYSRELRGLIAECLLIAPANRPSPEELVQRTGDGLGGIQMAMGTILGIQLAPYAEPVLSAQWANQAAPVQQPVPNNRARNAARPPPTRPTAQQAAAQPAQPAQRAPAVRAAAVAPAAPQPPPGPANLSPITRLTVIVQTKPTFGFIGGGHKNFVLENLNANMSVIQVKDMLAARGCGIKATSMNLMHGRVLMLNHQKLGEFSGLLVARAMSV